MGSKVLGCGEVGIDKNAFHNNKASIGIDEVEINKIALFDKTSCGKGSFKHYIGYFFFFLLTAIWLTHGQLWAILKGTASLTRC